MLSDFVEVEMCTVLRFTVIDEPLWLLTQAIACTVVCPDRKRKVED